MSKWSRLCNSSGPFYYSLTAHLSGPCRQQSFRAILLVLLFTAALLQPGAANAPNLVPADPDGEEAIVNTPELDSGYFTEVAPPATGPVNTSVELSDEPDDNSSAIHG